MTKDYHLADLDICEFHKELRRYLTKRERHALSLRMKALLDYDEDLGCVALGDILGVSPAAASRMLSSIQRKAWSLVARHFERTGGVA